MARNRLRRFRAIMRLRRMTASRQHSLVRQYRYLFTIPNARVRGATLLGPERKVTT